MENFQPGFGSEFLVSEINRETKLVAKRAPVQPRSIRHLRDNSNHHAVNPRLMILIQIKSGGLPKQPTALNPTPKNQGVEISRKNTAGFPLTGAGTLTPLVSPPGTSDQFVLKPTASV